MSVVLTPDTHPEPILKVDKNLVCNLKLKVCAANLSKKTFVKFNSKNSMRKEFDKIFVF